LGEESKDNGGELIEDLHLIAVQAANVRIQLLIRRILGELKGCHGLRSQTRGGGGEGEKKEKKEKETVDLIALNRLNTEMGDGGWGDGRWKSQVALDFFFFAVTGALELAFLANMR